jgi:hypothetical protein
VSGVATSIHQPVYSDIRRELSIARSKSTVERFPLNLNSVYIVLRYLSITSSYILPRREYQFFGVQPSPSFIQDSVSRSPGLSLPPSSGI